MTISAGELAALGAAGCWAISAIAFEQAGRRIGSLSVNLLRLIIALVLFGAVGWLTYGSPLPPRAPASAWLWLAASGLVGFVLGDLCLFRAYLELGSRLSSLVMSLAPAMAASIGWAALGETLAPAELAGMALTLGGIALAVTERRPPALHADAGQRRRGLWLALGGALGQAGGLVLSKLGMAELGPFHATQIRVMAGAAGFGFVLAALGAWPRVSAGSRHRSGMAFTVLGAVFGPFLGVWLSLAAIRSARVGIAASLMATTPILIIPLVVLWRRERVGPRAVVGAAVAVAGVVALVQ